jgi:nucleoside-diphosphate-sugar epimerase
MTKKILVLGCSGEIGSRLTNLFLAAGNKVYGIRGIRSCKIRNINHSCSQANLLDSSLDLNFNGMRPEILIHTAWVTKPGVFWDSPLNLAWVSASKKIVEKFKLSGGKYVVVTSSCAEYSWHGKNLLSELSPSYPSSEYGRAKNDLLKWLETQSLSYLWARIFFQFGLQETYGRLIPSLIDDVLAGNRYLIRSGHDVRDFVYVKDVAKVMEILIAKETQGIVNIGSGRGITVEKVARIISRLMAREDLLEFQIETRAKSTVVSDSRKLTNIIGNYSWTNFEEALSESIDSRKELFQSGRP